MFRRIVSFLGQVKQFLFKKQSSKTVKNVLAEERILLMDILYIFWDRKFIILLPLVFFIPKAYLTSIQPQDQYHASSTLLSETDLGSSGAGSLLEVLTGAEGGFSGSAEVGPGMFNSILRSSPFLLELIYTEFFIESTDSTWTLKDYLNQLETRNGYEIFQEILKRPTAYNEVLNAHKKVQTDTISKYRNEFGVFEFLEVSKTDSINVISSYENDAMAKLLQSVTINIDGRFVTIEVQMPDGRLAAQLNNRLKEKLVQYVVEYKTRKLRNQIEILKVKYEESEFDYLDTQKKLAKFRDDNRGGALSESARSIEDQLSVQFDIAKNLYITTASELESSRLQLLQETPIYSEFQPVILPTQPSIESARKIYITHLVLALAAGFLILLAKVIYDYFYMKEVSYEVQETN